MTTIHNHYGASYFGISSQKDDELRRELEDTNDALHAVSCVVEEQAAALVLAAEVKATLEKHIAELTSQLQERAGTVANLTSQLQAEQEKTSILEVEKEQLKKRAPKRHRVDEDETLEDICLDYDRRQRKRLEKEGYILGPALTQEGAPMLAHELRMTYLKRIVDDEEEHKE